MDLTSSEDLQNEAMFERCSGAADCHVCRSKFPSCSSYSLLGGGLSEARLQFPQCGPLSLPRPLDTVLPDHLVTLLCQFLSKGHLAGMISLTSQLNATVNSDIEDLADPYLLIPERLPPLLDRFSPLGVVVLADTSRQGSAAGSLSLWG